MVTPVKSKVPSSGVVGALLILRIIRNSLKSGSVGLIQESARVLVVALSARLLTSAGGIASGKVVNIKSPVEVAFPDGSVEITR